MEVVVEASGEPVEEGTALDALKPFTTCSRTGTGSASFQKTTRQLYLPLIFAPIWPFLGYLSFPDHKIHTYIQPIEDG